MSTEHRTDPIFQDDGRAQGEDPMAIFTRWYGAAKDLIGFVTTAMSLATVSPSGDPDVRIVLLQGISDGGLAFFTNLSSPKALQMVASGKAAACFHWPAAGQQVRFRGSVVPVDKGFADDYFAGRPRGSQIGAHASAQSSVIPGRADLLDRVQAEERRFAGMPVPRPDNWSGLRLVPDQIEFWEDGADRLHDRLLFTKSSGGIWLAARLSP